MGHSCCPRTDTAVVARYAPFVFCDGDPRVAGQVLGEVGCPFCGSCGPSFEFWRLSSRPFRGFAVALELFHTLLESSWAARHVDVVSRLLARGSLDELHAAGGHQALLSIPGATAEPRRVARASWTATLKPRQPRSTTANDGTHRNGHKATRDKNQPTDRARPITQDEPTDERRGEGGTGPSTRSRRGNTQTLERPSTVNRTHNRHGRKSPSKAARVVSCAEKVKGLSYPKISPATRRQEASSHRI